jgi:glycerol-3-phosphate dehydrogenase subunit B
MSGAAHDACDLCVIGSGMAGMSAALFAVNRGLSTVLVGRTGEIIFATGLLDLMAVHPVENGRSWEDPWAAIAALVRDLPRHPYGRLSPENIEAAFAELTAFLGDNGLPYAGHARRNATVPTAAGTLKRTFRVPETMWPGAQALARRAACLVAGIHGLKGFSARQIAAALGASWPGIRTATLTFPVTEPPGEVFAERMARALELEATRVKFAAAIAPHVQGAEAVGLPAVLGVSGSAAVAADIARRIGAAVFEIPTMPPGVTGLRLKEAFERGLAARGVTLCLENKVFKARPGEADGFVLDAGRVGAEHRIAARAVILATGRFMGGGLSSDRRRLRETLFDLPVAQPEGRGGWHRPDFLDPRGHPVNRAGIEVDERFRPLGADGAPAHPRLFAAGSILAHQDWIRMKCGSGLAIATALGAAAAAAEAVRGGT